MDKGFTFSGCETLNTCENCGKSYRGNGAIDINGLRVCNRCLRVEQLKINQLKTDPKIEPNYEKIEALKVDNAKLGAYL